MNRPLLIRSILALLAGLSLAAAFPTLNWSALAWVAPGVMLFAAMGQSGMRAFGLGYLAGLAHYLASLHWLLFLPYPSGAVAGWLALSLYLALWPGAWVWLCWRMFPLQAATPSLADATSSVRVTPASAQGFEQPTTDPHLGDVPGMGGLSGRPVAAATGQSGAAARPAVAPSREAPLAGVEGFVSTTVWQRLMWALCCATAWVAWEMLVGRLLTGFPWNFLGVSQHRMLPLIQVAAVTGVYGVSFLVAWTSVSLGCAALALVHRPQQRWGWFAEARLPVVVVVIVVLIGLHRVLQPAPPGRELKIALVQPSFPQTRIWDPAQDTNRFEHLMRLSELALGAMPDLLVWPESAVPSLLRYNEHVYRGVTNLVRRHGVWLILCADDAEPRAGAGGRREYDTFNSSFLVSAAGDLVATYRKQRLVMFGEYVPLGRWLPFLHWFTPIEGGFTPGERPVQFRIRPLGVQTSPLICFEDIFPHLARRAVETETDFLVNLTNDAWFGRSAQQWQHAANALFRAVENGLPLVRCTNNGLTCWIDSHGRMHEVFFGRSNDIYGEGFKIARMRLPVPGQARTPTFYWHHGDWFGWACVGWTALVGWNRVWRKRRRSGRVEPPGARAG
ncbi:MAG: apolipoprotein N-acyltransferase [Verrucomicrobiales bacterium]|nr:apolipoprotein N-acyltransferase [Verrucomicrobiales bacterium]